MDGCTEKHRKYGLCEKHLWKSDVEKVRTKRRYWANPQKEKERNTKRADQIVKHRAARYLEKKPEILKKNSDWAKNNPAKRRASNINYKMRKLGVDGSHTAEQIQALFKKQRGRCAVCRTTLTKSFHRDHVKALSIGGNNDIKNIQLLCKSCNSSKKNKDDLKFMQQKGYLL